jgi:uncharacterized coiled-coil DUF342 family protein
MTPDDLFIDALATERAQLEDRLVAAVQDREAYRLLACEALSAVSLLTADRDELRQRVRDLRAEIRDLMSITQDRAA